MIQSSQPISLKFTCRCFLWQRCRAFPGWFLESDCMGSSRTFFVPLAAGALLIRRWVNRYSSRLLLLPKAKRKAFSLFVLPRRANPRERRSMGRPLRCSRASNSKQSCWEGGLCCFFKLMKVLEMSKTSHLLLSVLSRSSMLFTCSRTHFCLAEAQVYSFSSGPWSSETQKKHQREEMQTEALRSVCLIFLLLCIISTCRFSLLKTAFIITNFSHDSEMLI
uniref:Uncharacterized protein n=1 Tax=Oryzias melastigma TaxID=30732 RepID=A0A3B3D0X8_ORYME